LYALNPAGFHPIVPEKNAIVKEQRFKHVVDCDYELVDKMKV
jgi:hypothetical protein